MIQEVTIETPSIKLDQFLKWCGIASTGGEAKFLITDGQVKVNGTVESKRGKSLSYDDIIEVADIGIFKIIPSN